MNAVKTMIHVAAVAFLFLSGCSSLTGTSDACDSTESAGSCSGTFACGNSGISGVCDRATQVCVVQPGSVGCVTIAGASATKCPSLAQAVTSISCTGRKTSCSGSSASGVTVTCK
jgi:hypothetical protein